MIAVVNATPPNMLVQGCAPDYFLERRLGHQHSPVVCNQRVAFFAPATLAATLVGYNTVNAAGERLLSGEIFNAVLVLLVVTSVLSTVLTELFTPGMLKEEARTKATLT